MRGVLALPFAYSAFGALVGAPRGHALFVRDHVRPERGERLLDIGCGPGDLLPHLPQVDYLGFDPSAEYIRAARARHPGASFSCQGVADHVVQPESFDVAVACGVLHHLGDAEALELLRLARASLRPGGRLVTLDGCLVAGQSRVARWLLSRDRGRHVRSEERYVALARTVFPDVLAVIRQDLLRVPYTHLLMRCGRA